MTEVHHPDTVAFAELNRGELQALATVGLVVLPLGATEQHGPHLPAGTDSLTVEWIARASALRVATECPIVVAPVLAFGCSDYHLPFGSTMSLSSETLLKVLHDLGSSLVRSGFRRLFILNGHGGNHELAQVAARDLAVEHAVDVATGSWWSIAWHSLVAAGMLELGRVPGHAGTVETSIVLELAKDLVLKPLPHRETDWTPSDPAGFGQPVRVDRHGSWQRIDGYSDDPATATAARGRAVLDAAVEAVAASLLAFWADTRDASGGR